MYLTWFLSILRGSMTTMRSVYLSQLIKQATDQTARNKLTMIWKTVQTMLYAEVLLSLINILKVRVSDLGLKRIMRNLDLMLYHKLLQQDAEYFDVQENTWE